MPYQSFFASKPSSAPAQQSNGVKGYASFFGGTTIGQPSQKEIDDNNKANAAAQPKPIAQPAPQKSQSLFSKVKTGVKDFASSASIGEQKFAQGIARDLPGGTNDLKAQVQSANQDTKNLKTYTDLHKAGKISDAQYKKLTGSVAQQSSDTQKTTTDITKKMPTKAQIGLGAASTAADIITAGTLPEIKGAVTAAKTTEVATKGSKLLRAVKPVAQLSTNAAAGGLNAAAGGGTKGDIIKNAAAGAVLPEALHYGAKGISRLLPKAASKVEQKVAEEVKPPVHTTPQPGDIIKPTPMEPTPLHAKVAEDVTNRAHIENPVVQQKMQGVAKDVEGTYKPNPVPDAHVTLDKAATEHNGAVGEVPTVGGTLVVKDHSPAGIDKAVSSIKEQYPTAEKVPSDIPGETKVQFSTESGHTGEVAISSPELAQAKNLQADMVKNTAEAGPAHAAAAQEQANTLYKNANEAADARLKQEQAIAPKETATPAAKSAPVKSEPKASAAEMPVSSPESTPKPTVPHSDSSSRVYERLKAEHPDALSEDVKYDKLNLKEDAAKATDLVSKDKNQAYRVAMGAEHIKGQTNTAVNIALSEKALDEGNHSLYAQLVKNRSLEQTRRGQEIVAEKGSVTDNSTSRYVKELLAARMQKLGKGFTADINTKLVKTETSAKRAIAAVDKEVAKAQKRIQYKQMDMQNAQSILEKLTCK